MTNPAGEDDDALNVYGETESIQDYMAELLQRVEEGANPTQASTVTRVTVPLEVETSSIDEAAPEIDPTMDMDRVQLDPTEFVPRAAAPEATSNLQALRAVANSSARSAIDKHRRHRYEQLAVIFWGVAAVALMVGGALVVWVDDLFTLTAFASVASLLLGGFAVLSALVYTAKATMASQPVPKMLAETGSAVDKETDQESRAAAGD